MKRWSFVAGCSILLAGTVAWGQWDSSGKPKSYIRYTAEAQSVPAGKPATLELRFRVESGYHVNSHTPKSDLLIPTVLTLQPDKGVKTTTPEYPAGTSYSFSFDPKEKLDVYQGDFTLRVPVLADPGEHTLEGTLRYQACDNAACYPPRSLPVEAVFTAK